MENPFTEVDRAEGVHSQAETKGMPPRERTLTTVSSSDVVLNLLGQPVEHRHRGRDTTGIFLQILFCTKRPLAKLMDVCVG